VLSLSKIVPDVATYAQALVLGNPLIVQGNEGEAGADKNIEAQINPVAFADLNLAGAHPQHRQTAALPRIALPDPAPAW
jgi:hypothetical protein